MRKKIYAKGINLKGNCVTKIAILKKMRFTSRTFISRPECNKVVSDTYNLIAFWCRYVDSCAGDDQSVWRGPIYT